MANKLSKEAMKIQEAYGEMLAALRIAEEELRFDAKHAVVKATGERRLVSHALALTRSAIAKGERAHRR